MSSIPDGKVCTHCKAWKPFADFAKHRTNPDGLQYFCRKCGTEIHREYYKRNKERLNKYRREKYSERIDVERNHARGSYYRQRQDPAKLQAMRLKKLDAIHRRKAKMGKADPETLTYMAVLVNDPCSYCGVYPAGTVDHMTPIALGGSHHWSNLTAACETCNKSKNDKGLLHYLLWKLGAL